MSTPTVNFPDAPPPGGSRSSVWRSLLERVIPKTDQSNDIFREQQARTAVTTDRAFAVLLGLEWPAAVALALWISPQAWRGSSHTVHEHVWAALLLGGAVVIPPLLSVRLRPGTAGTRQLVAVGQI